MATYEEALKKIRYLMERAPQTAAKLEFLAERCAIVPIAFPPDGQATRDNPGMLTAKERSMEKRAYKAGDLVRVLDRTREGHDGEVCKVASSVAHPGWTNVEIWCTDRIMYTDWRTEELEPVAPGTPTTVQLEQAIQGLDREQVSGFILGADYINGAHMVQIGDWRVIRCSKNNAIYCPSDGELLVQMYKGEISRKFRMTDDGGLERIDQGEPNRIAFNTRPSPFTLDDFRAALASYRGKAYSIGVSEAQWEATDEDVYGPLFDELIHGELVVLNGEGDDIEAYTTNDDEIVLIDEYGAAVHSWVRPGLHLDCLCDGKDAAERTVAEPRPEKERYRFSFDGLDCGDVTAEEVAAMLNQWAEAEGRDTFYSTDGEGKITVGFTRPKYCCQPGVYIEPLEEEAFSAEFELPGGERFEVPRPEGEGWKVAEQDDYPWRPTYVNTAGRDRVDGRSAYNLEDPDAPLLEFQHPVAHEYAERAEQEQARCLWWSRWTRPAVDFTSQCEEVTLPGTQPVPRELRDTERTDAPQGEWPETGHPRRVIQG